MSKSLVLKPFKVEFVDGPLNGAIRYYSSLAAARSAARRYVRRPLSGRFLFKFPSCEIFFINDLWQEKFLEVVY